MCKSLTKVFLPASQWGSPFKISYISKLSKTKRGWRGYSTNNTEALPGGPSSFWIPISTAPSGIFPGLRPQVRCFPPPAAPIFQFSGCKALPCTAPRGTSLQLDGDFSHRFFGIMCGVVGFLVGCQWLAFQWFMSNFKLSSLWIGKRFHLKSLRIRKPPAVLNVFLPGWFPGCAFRDDLLRN